MVERASAAASNVKNTIVRTSDRIQEFGSSQQATPSEYAGDKFQYNLESIASESGHIVVSIGKHAIRRYHKKRKTEAKHEGHARAEEVSGKKDAVARAEESPPPNSPSITPPDAAPEVGPDLDSNNAASSPKSSQRVTSKKLAKDPAKTLKNEDRQISRSVKTADRSIKDAQRTVKTVQQSSEAAIKTVQEVAKTTQKSVQTAAKATEKAAHAARTAAKGAKAAVKAAAAAIKSIIAAAKELVVAIMSGGWIAVVIIIVIMLVALLVGSSYGIFFSSEDTKSQITMQEVVQELNHEYQASINRIRDTISYDRLSISRSRASWSEVLAVYAVKVNTDPHNPQDVASMDRRKKALLEEIFWEMNQISYWVHVQEKIILVEETDENGGTIVKEETIVIRTLYITASHKTPTEMALTYGFTDEQQQLLRELLKDQNKGLWDAVLSGVS